jgi:hypothetical protein
LLWKKMHLCEDFCTLFCLFLPLLILPALILARIFGSLSLLLVRIWTCGGAQSSRVHRRVHRSSSIRLLHHCAHFSLAGFSLVGITDTDIDRGSTLHFGLVACWTISGGKFTRAVWRPSHCALICIGGWVRESECVHLTARPFGSSSFSAEDSCRRCAMP